MTTATPASTDARRHSGARSSTATGTWQLTRAAVRRDRVRIVLWSVGLVAMVALSAESVRNVFPTQESLDAAAASSQNPAVLAFQGPDLALDTLGGQVAFQIGAPGLVFMALMALLMTGRLTRAEEEAGRFELVRALPVGRDAPLLASAAVLAAMSAAIGVGIGAATFAAGLPAHGTVVFALGYTVIGLLFSAMTSVTAQISESSRLATGLVGCALGAAFVLRAIGDMTAGPARVLVWASPIGWIQQSRPWAGERWWPLGLGLGVTATLILVAMRLQGRRDLGAGLIAPRAGPATASDGLATPLALARRLQVGTLAGWTAGTAFLALVYGALTEAIEDFVRDNPDLAEFLQARGGDLTDAYLATAARTIALIGSGYAVQSTLRLRGEETAMRTEPVLATATSRTRYWRAHATVAVAGTAIVLTVAGLVLGVAAAIAAGDTALVLRGVGATVVHLPAATLLIAFALLLTGLAPRRTALAWALLTASLVVTMFGPLLDLPSWAMRSSPFELIERVPAERLTPWPIAGLTSASIVLGGVGLIGYRRRDIPAS